MSNSENKIEIDAKLFETPALADVQQDIQPLAEVEVDDRHKVESLISGIDVKDSNSVIFFGSGAQQKLTELSDSMLEGVRNKDLGSAGDSLNEMVATLRGFSADGLEKPGFFARLFGAAKPVAKFLQRYEDVRRQTDRITDDLEDHKTKLLTDVVSLDRLYNANLEYFHELDLYIMAGEEKLRQLDAQVIPDMVQAAKADDDVLKAQELRDVRSVRDDLERRVHDLRLTRQVTMQSLPSIRLVQENDKGLVTKINSTLVNTVPLWRQQLAIAVTIFRSQQAAGSVKSATDLTNDLLRENAENLKQANAEVRAQIERGVFDMDAVRHANQTLIDTIEDGLRIADEGKRLRAEAVTELQDIEARLRDSLSAAKAKAAPTAVQEG
jgi:uncharacterized protein YaaN involved in tellurite resistance